MHPHQYVNLLKKRKRQATRSLFVSILVAGWICIFLFGQRQRIIEMHESLVESADASFIRYFRLTALQHHSPSLYRFCITQGLIHQYHFQGQDRNKSLAYVRQFIDIGNQQELGNYDVPVYKDSMRSVEKIRRMQPQISALANWMWQTKFQTPMQIDSIPPPTFKIPDKEGTIKVDYWKQFIPFSDTTKPLTEELLDWVYFSINDVTEGVLELNTSTDFTSTEAFRGRHYEHHEKMFLEKKALLGGDWNQITDFLKEQWLKFDLQTADPEKQRISGSFSEVQLYGFSVNLIFFLYLIGPVIAGLLVWEYSVMQQPHRLNKGKSVAPVWLFEYDRLMKGLPFEKIIIVSMKLLEECLRLTGLAVVLYGALFRFSYLDEKNIPFNFFFVYHTEFQFLDLTTVISLGIALLVSSQNFSWNFPATKKWMNNRISRFFSWSGLLLPVAILLLSYITSFDFSISYFSPYGVIYFAVLTIFLMILYRAILKANLSGFYYLLLAALYWAWNGPVFLASLGL